MRLHTLEIQAFGPFPTTVTVDFDELSDSGLFLLSGPTGAGKTSVLDAVCFALYGDVPGDRGSARRLRCDTAPAGLPPRVVLQLTLSGRRFRLTRSPQWVRPKRRGTGTTTEQAHVVCEERRSGEWVALSNRLDETGHLITGLLGMNLGQFCQVAMLPQGQFQGFLRARSEERHTLLQRLFATTRFEQVERWLRDHARGLRRRCDEREQEVTLLLSRMHEASGVPAPDDWAEADLAARAESGALEAWVTAEATRAHTESLALAARLVEAEQMHEEARAAAETARERTALRSRGARAQAELAALDAVEDEQVVRKTRLSDARRAEPVLPLHRMHQTAIARVDAAEEMARGALVTVWQALTTYDGSLPVPLPDELLSAEFLEVRLAPVSAQVERGRAQLPAGSERREVDQSLAGVRTALLESATARDEVRATREALPDQIAALDDQLTGARAAVASAELLTSRVHALREAHGARSRLIEREDALTRAQETVSAAIDRIQLLKEAWLDLREARINGIAAELAADLAVGADCPVCGSHDHPNPAVGAPGAPTAQAEKAARSQVDDAEFERVQAESELRGLLDEVTVLRARAGDLPLETLAEQLSAAMTDQRETTERAAQLQTLDSRLTALRAALTAAHARETALVCDLATREAQQEALELRRDEIDRQLAAVLLGTPFEEVASLVEAGEHVLIAGAAASRALATLVAAEDGCRAAADSLSQCVTEQGFVTVDSALAAVLDGESYLDLETRARDHERRLDAVRATLVDPSVVEALAAVPVDLSAVEAAEQEARVAAEQVRLKSSTTLRRAERLRSLSEEFAEVIKAWRPLRTKHAVAAELAAFVEGKSVDNEWRMRLSAYVLAWRLGQVVDAANERLVRMTSGRYVLEHTGRRGSGETRGGLSLAVRDEWSGEARDPVTLSGGETFVVSLALALGLADVVAHEVGGSQLDTLFVDEGFGSLDSETLDDVMDTLDALREGGRVVGVVSHVAEMRSRIPTQLLVGKGRDGSTLAIIHGVN